MELWLSEKDLGWSRLIEVGLEAYEDEYLSELVDYHASLAAAFIKQGSAFLVGQAYVNDIGFEPEAEAALLSASAFPTDIGAFGLPDAGAFPEGLFVPEGSTSILSNFDLRYAICVRSLFIFRGFVGPLFPSSNLADERVTRSLVYSDDGIRYLGGHCKELIAFGGDGEYLRSWSRICGDPDWLDDYKRLVAHIGSTD